MYELQLSKIFFSHLRDTTAYAYMYSFDRDSLPQTSNWVVRNEFVEWVIDSVFTHNPVERFIGRLCLPFDTIIEAIDYIYERDTANHLREYTQTTFLVEYGRQLLATDREYISNFIRKEFSELVKRDAVNEFERKVGNVSDERFKQWYKNELYYRQKIPSLSFLNKPNRLSRQTNRPTPRFSERCYDSGITFDMLWNVFLDDMKNRDKWIKEIKDVLDEAPDLEYIASPEYYVDVVGWRAEHVKARIQQDRIIRELCNSVTPRRSERIRKMKRKRKREES
jgi:hypothetical protein